MADVVKLAAAGYRVSPEWVAERTGYELEKVSSGEVSSFKQDITNTRRGEWIADVRRPAWIDALREDLQPLGKALAGALRAGDEAAMRGALRKISAEMPEFLDSPALEDALAEDFATALAGEDGDVRNSGNSQGAKKGWETRRANGWVPAPRLVTPQAADAELDRGFSVNNKNGESIRFGAELKRKLNDKVTNEADRNARKQRLPWAKLAVSDGRSETSRVKGGIRTLYSKTFRKGAKHQNIEVIVDTLNGYAWNIMVKGGSANDIR